MSSAGGDGGVTSGEPPRQYFCHQCDRNVTVTPSSSSDLVCPICNDGFLEELETPIPNPNPNPTPTSPFFSFTSDFPAGTAGAFPLLFSGAGAPADTQPFDDLFPLFGSRGDAAATADAFNPLVFLQNYVQTLRAGGANVQFVIENSGDPTGTFRFPGNLNHGDYFFGPGLEELIQHLAENDPNRYGTPPASKSAVERLPDIKVTEELMVSDSAQCAVCKDTFKLGEAAKQLPCKHIYHADCILPWLELHNSCPVCRFELPTDDPDYEQRARRGGGVPAPVNLNWAVGPGGLADSSGGNAGGGGGENTHPVIERRRFRVSLPWFRPFASSVAETSNVGNANNNNNNNNNSGNDSGQSNPETRGNQNFESETRQEDLD